MENQQLTIVPKDHFDRDPIFTECSHMVQKERMSEVKRLLQKPRNLFFKEHNLHTGVKIPWHWNTTEMREEFFNGPPNIDESFELDTSKWFYNILLDVQHFTPGNLKISVTNTTVTIKGGHEERSSPFGSVSRHFIRKYTFPIDVCMDEIRCHLSSDGVLHIAAPRKHDEIPVISDKHSLPTLKPQVSKTSLVSDNENYECFIQTIPDFDMVPFWAREVGLDSHFGVKTDLEKFKVVIDVSHFAPEEVNVYSTPNYITVQGKHEEREDAHGFITRHFTRKYWMLAGVNSADLNCHMTSNGVLEITAPMPNHNNKESVKTLCHMIQAAPAH